MDIRGDAAPYRDMLCGIFGLSELVVENIDEDIARARFTEHAGYCHLIIHGLAYNVKTDEATLPELDLIYGKNFIITVHRSALPWLDDLHHNLLDPDAEIEGEAMSRGMGFLLYTMLDNQVESYFPVLEEIDDVIDEMEDLAINDTSNTVQARLFRIKRSLTQMRRVISPQIEVANSLRGRSSHLISPELLPYLGDVYDHMIRAFEILDSYRDLMNGLLDVYLTTVSNRLNVIMKQMTIIATIFMPITFITGVFGQNFGHSPQVDMDAGYNFWVVLAVMALITVGQFWIFKRRGWL